MGKYVQMSLALSTATTDRDSLVVTGPMTAAELQSLALPERAIIHNLHTLATSMTQCLEEFKLGMLIGCC